MAARPGRRPSRPSRRVARRDGTLESLGRERDRERGAGHSSDDPDRQRLLAGYDAAMATALAEVEHAFAIAGGSWAERMRAAIARLLELAAHHPEQAELCTVGVFAAGPDGLGRRDAWMARFAALCDAGYARDDRAGEPPRLMSPLAAGALFELVRTHVAEERLDELEAALPAALLIVLGPAVGRDGALRLAG